MKYNLKYLCCFLCPVVLLSCTTQNSGDNSKKTNVYIDKITLVNNTSTTLDIMKIRVVATNKVVSCGNIPSRQRCGTKFPKLEYKKNSIIIGWVRDKKNYFSEEFVVPLGKGIKRGDLIQGIVDINDDNTITVDIEVD